MALNLGLLFAVYLLYPQLLQSKNFIHHEEREDPEASKSSKISVLFLFGFYEAIGW
ncbi:MAG TPA: hypothetical protein PLX69_14560 [Leptospiraceae bacterium]|nr:hypothetical protein [Leptospiraceae bacterium]